MLNERCSFEREIRDLYLEREAPSDEELLSGEHWKTTADEKWSNSIKIDDLESTFKEKVRKFKKMLEDNKVTIHIASTKRPPERAYLMHYSNEIRKGNVSPSDVPSKDGVNIKWDHGDLTKSKNAADELRKAFGVGTHAALTSRHTEGKAIDMKLDFSENENEEEKHVLKYTLEEGGEITREILWDANEARYGEKAKNKSITNIEDRELSKAGADFGLYRKIDSDVVHWSSDGK